MGCQLAAACLEPSASEGRLPSDARKGSEHAESVENECLKVTNLTLSGMCYVCQQACDERQQDW